MCVAILQAGFVGLTQSLFCRQPTHTPAATLQSGVAPAHCVWLVAEHWPQAPLGWQAGVAPLQLASLVHGPQVCVPVLQTGVVPPQSALERHCTQVKLGRLQRSVAPLQLASLVHCTH